MNQSDQAGELLDGEGPKWTTRDIVNATLVVTAITVAFFLLFRYYQIIFTLFIAVVLSTAIRPAVNRLSRLGVSRSLGIILVYLLILLVVIGMIALTTPLLARQVAAIGQLMPDFYSDFRSNLFLSENLVLQRIALNLPGELALAPDEQVAAPATQPGAAPPVETTPSAPPAPVVNYLALASRGILAFVSVFIIGFYWTLERDRSMRSWLLWAPINRREAVRELIQEIEDKVGGFIIGQGILCLAVGIMALIAYMIIGVPYAFVLAILAGILEAVPVFGPALGAAPALLIALATDPGMAVWVAVSAIVIQTLENYLLVPRIMQRSVGVNSLVLLLAFVAFSLLFGFAGAIVSVPLAAILQLLVNRYLLMPNLESGQQVELGRDQVSLFRMETQALATDIRKQLLGEKDKEAIEEDAIDRLEAITNDLDSILANFAAESRKETKA